MTCAPSIHAGRPRVHDREKIAEELIEWAMKDDSLNLCEFCCTRQPPLTPSKITHWSNESEEFRQAVDIAKAAIGSRRERKLTNNELHVKAYDLNATTYDYFLKHEKRDQAKYESDLGKEADKALPEYYIKLNEKLREELAAARQALSERKRADTSIINDNKS